LASRTYKWGRRDATTTLRLANPDGDLAQLLEAEPALLEPPSLEALALGWRQRLLRSPAMLDKTYGRMLPDALDRARSALDAFVWGLSGDGAEEANQ
jgi:hypothetical protein